MAPQVRMKAWHFLIMIAVLLPLQTARATEDDRVLLQAYSSILTGAPPSMQMDGEVKPGRLIELYNGTMKFGSGRGNASCRS